MKNKNEQRVEHDVRRRAEQHREHAARGEALGVDIHVHAEGYERERRPDEIHCEILARIGACLLARGEHRYHRIEKRPCEQPERNGRDEQHGEGVAHHAGGLVVIPAAARHGAERRAALSEQARERREDRNDRQRDADARERHAADIGNMADVDTVHHVVEHVHELRGNERQRHAHDDRGDIPLGKIVLYVFFRHGHFSPRSRMI